MHRVSAKFVPSASYSNLSRNNIFNSAREDLVVFAWTKPPRNLKLNPLRNRGGHFPLGPKKQRENNGLLSECTLLGFNPNASSSSNQSLLGFNPNASSFHSAFFIYRYINGLLSETSCGCQITFGFTVTHLALQMQRNMIC